VHCNQSIASQADMVKKAKRHVSGFILEPFTLKPDDTVRDLVKLKREQGISGVCITDNGRLGGKLVGFVTARDFETVHHLDRKIEAVMVKQVVKAEEPISIEEAMNYLKRAKVGKLPIVNKQGCLTTMVTRTDIKKVRDYPHMSRDFNGQLIVGAAVKCEGWDNNNDQQPLGSALDRARGLAEAGADILCLDPNEASNDSQLKMIQRLKEEYPRVEIMVGPVVSCREAKRAIEAGADTILVGGGGSMSVGRSEATALFELAKYAHLNYGTPVIAAGSMRHAGDVLKALCLGASGVMLREPLAGADEAPGREQINGGLLQKLHGGGEQAGAVAAMRHEVCAGGIIGSRSQFPRDVVQRNFCEPSYTAGSVRALIPYIAQGVLQGMRDLGLGSIAAAHEALASGELRMECRSAFAAQAREVHKQSERHATHPGIVPISAFVNSNETTLA